MGSRDKRHNSLQSKSYHDSFLLLRECEMEHVALMGTLFSSLPRFVQYRGYLAQPQGISSACPSVSQGEEVGEAVC